MAWTDFQASFDFLAAHNLLKSMARGRDGVLIEMSRFMRLQEIRYISQSSDSSSLMKIPRAIRNSEITNSKKKVIGVLEMLEELSSRLKAFRLSKLQKEHSRRI